MLFVVFCLAVALGVFHFGDVQTELNCLNAIYLSFEVFTSVGFGDIVPQTKTTYCILIAQMIMQLIFVYILFATFVTKMYDDTFYNKQKTKNR